MHALNNLHSSSSQVTNNSGFHSDSIPNYVKNARKAGIKLHFHSDSTSSDYIKNARKAGVNFHLNFDYSPPPAIDLTTKNIFKAAVQTAAPTGPKLHQPIVSPLVLSGTNVAGSIAGVIRNVFSVFNRVFGTQNPRALTALGLTSVFSIASNVLSIRNGIQDIKTAEKTSDVAGSALAYLKVARGGFFAVREATSFYLRVVSVVALVTTYTIVIPLAEVLNYFNTGLFSIASFLGIVVLGIRLDEHRQFRSGLNPILNDPDLNQEMRSIRALEHLKKLASVTSEEKIQILTALANDQAYQTATPKQQVEIAAKKEKQLLQKKEAHLKRVIGSDCLKLIRQKVPSEATIVIKAVQESNKVKVIVASCAMVITYVGLVMAIAGVIFASPAMVMASTIVSLATSLSWLLVNSHGLIEAFKENQPGRFDKLWMLLSSILAITSVSIVFCFSGGTAPWIAAAVVGTVWLGMNATIYLRQHQKKKEVLPLRTVSC